MAGNPKLLEGVTVSLDACDKLSPVCHIGDWPPVQENWGPLKVIGRL